MIFLTKTLQKQCASPMRMRNIIMLIYGTGCPKCPAGNTLPTLNVNSTLINTIITTSNSFAFITFCCSVLTNECLYCSYLRTVIFLLLIHRSFCTQIKKYLNTLYNTIKCSVFLFPLPRDFCISCPNLFPIC